MRSLLDDDGNDEDTNGGDDDSSMTKVDCLAPVVTTVLLSRLLKGL